MTPLATLLHEGGLHRSPEPRHSLRDLRDLVRYAVTDLYRHVDDWRGEPGQRLEETAASLDQIASDINAAAVLLDENPEITQMHDLPLWEDAA